MMLADWLMMGSTGSVAIASSTQGENTSKTQTTLAIAKPTCILNDVLISLALSDNNGTWTTHTGFTELLDSQHAEISRRTVDTTEAATLTYTASANHAGASGAVVCLRGGTYDTIGSVSSQASSPAAPSITMTGAGIVLAIFWRAADTIAFTTPTGFVPVVADSDGDSPSYAIFYKVVDAGATGTVTSTLTAGKGYGVLVGVKAS